MLSERCIFIFASDLSTSDGGPAVVVSAMAKSLSASVKIFVVDKRFNIHKFVNQEQIPFYDDRNVNSLFINFYRLMALVYQNKSSGGNRTSFIINGVWNPICFVAHLMALFFNVDYYILPHGSLQPYGLNQRRLKKKIALSTYIKTYIYKAKAFIVPSTQEKLDLISLFPAKSIFVIPFGVEFDKGDWCEKDLIVNSCVKNLKSECNKVLLYLGRLDPVKGLPDLLHAWNELSSYRSSWFLVIAGSGEAKYVDYIESLVSELCIPNVLLVGQVSRYYKRELLDCSDVVVLPSYSENFGMVVPEALSCGVPVLVTSQTPWAHLEQLSAGWSTPCGVQGLFSGLKVVLTASESELREFGYNGRALAKREFCWDEFSKSVLKVIN